MSLWTSKEVAAATQGQCASDFEVSGLSIDSRSIGVGDLFIALRAERDGHTFVQKALEQGASGALVDHIPEGVRPEKLILVQDTMIALENLGKASRARTSGKIVAVTGSAGKTGTKEQLRTIFEKAIPNSNVHAAVKSFNNHIGVPLTLARMPQHTDYGVFEIGMNHPGEIAPLTKMCKPDVAMITTVGSVHLAAFDDVTGIAREKASIFAGLERTGVAVLPRDNQHYSVLLSEAKKYGLSHTLTFGTHQDADARLLECSLLDTQTVAKARVFDTELLYKIGGVGQHLALNALGALLCAHACGVDLAMAALALAHWSPPAGRGNRWSVSLRHDKQFTLIDDSYNANPSSMAASLDILAHTKTQGNGHKVAVLTDMLELGDQELELHANLAKLPAIQSIDIIHAAGTRMKALFDALPQKKQGIYAPDVSELLVDFRKQIRDNDVVMVKGSNGSKASQIVDYLKTLGNASSISEQTPSHQKEDTLQ